MNGARLGKQSSELEAELLRTLAQHEELLRQALVAPLNGPALRASTAQVYEAPRWYEARTAQELHALGYPVAPEELEFSVDPTCAWWHDAERDLRDGAVIRFFVERAWLVMQPPTTDVSALELTIHFALCDEAVDRLEVRIGEADAPRLGSRIDAFGRVVLAFAAPPLAGGPVRVDLACPVHAVVSEMFPGATDHRRLSLAVGWPRWLDPA